MAEISGKTQQIIDVLEQNIEILTKELDLGIAYLSQMKSGSIVHNDATQQENELQGIVADLQSKAQKFIDKLSSSDQSSSSNVKQNVRTTKTESIASESNIEQNLNRHHEEDESTLDMLERMQRKIIAQEQLSGIYREYHSPENKTASKTKSTAKKVEQTEINELEQEIDRLKLFDKLADLKSKMGYD